MKLFKSLIFALSLAFSFGFLPTAVIAAAGPTSAAAAAESIDIVIHHTQEGIKAIDAEEGDASVRLHIRAALRECKKITGAEMLEKKRLKVSRLLKKARTELKNGDAAKAKAFLIDAEEKFGLLKKYI